MFHKMDSRDILLRTIILRVYTLLILLVYGLMAEANPLPPYRLILGLDGVGYGLMEELHGKGAFPGFQPPKPLLATFPSISDPNWTLITGAPLEDSYTKSYFDMTPNSDGSIGSEVGSVLSHITTPPRYEKLFNFRPKGIWQHLLTVTWSQTSSLFWIDTLKKELLEPKKLKGDLFSALIINTDIISHVSGKPELTKHILEIEKKLRSFPQEFQKAHNRELEIIFLSDHGSAFLKPRSIEFQKPLEKKGWTWSSSLKKDTDYAFVAPEIISFAAFYTKPKKECEFAQAISEVPGVHVAFCLKDKNTLRFYSENGTIEVAVSPQNSTLSLQRISGSDPFGHDVFFKKKPSLSWKEYFDKSFETNYPNALIRAWESFYVSVKHPASVLVSTKKGYVFTNLTLEILTVLSGVQSTHGSFEKEESLGVVMSTAPLEETVFTPQKAFHTFFNRSPKSQD